MKKNINGQQLAWGFTLIEFAVVLGMLTIILAFGLPVGFENYKNYLLNREVKSLVSVLRRAENLSLTQAHSTNYGIAFSPERFVIFQGASYASRNQSFDEFYDKSEIIDVTITPPVSEISFAPVSGLPSATATFVLENGTNSIIIKLNGQGVVDW